MGAFVADFGVAMFSLERFEATALLSHHHSVVKQLDLSSQRRLAVHPLVCSPIEQLKAPKFLVLLFFRKIILHALVESLRFGLVSRLPAVDSLMLQYVRRHVLRLSFRGASKIVICVLDVVVRTLVMRFQVSVIEIGGHFRNR